MPVNLDAGQYALRMRDAGGQTVPGSERTLVVFAPRRTGVGYTVLPDRPLPMTEREVQRMLGPTEQPAEGPSDVPPPPKGLDVGDRVRVVDGIFNGQEGIVKQILDTVGKSENRNTGAGVWEFDTATGGPREVVTAPAQEGLQALVQHQVGWQGDKFEVPFTSRLGSARVNPASVDLSTAADQPRPAVNPTSVTTAAETNKSSTKA